MIKKGLQVPVPTAEAKLNCYHVIYMVAMDLYHDLKRRRDIAVAKTKHDGDSRKRVFVTIHDLPTTFRPTDAKFRLRYGSIGDTIRRKHCQLFEKDDQVYYINPDLVNDGNVVLYRTCARDPRSVTFSIANNHDYGRGDELPELNEVVMNCISPVRKFVMK
ncbi:hypothetical protein F441_15563 [Phytophthora nicotianae CJ01A1]|uniref:Uncharacterized protein n=2 Tax=Phytophthora nicotianae TaxID=4792 RepID=W2WFV5_PHYNI|nr:hypothetical protein L916_15175 [Phytophthora nicotianae]ETP08464.1 hypothetical protein F441_15563 [Phytophthora nicotianae CJ01A1]